MNLHFDPRTKLVCLILVVINTMFFPSLEWESIWVILICVLGIISGNGKRSILWVIIYFLAYTGWNLFLQREAGISHGISHAIILAWLGLVFKLFPCCMMSGIMIRTTQINDFLTAMNQSHVPKQVIIPIAVLLRYMPTLKEDWGYIKDAMVLRGVTPSLAGFVKSPMTTVECLYVPLLITASKTADELSIAAVTRGIENPDLRSSIRKLRFRVYDHITLLLLISMTVLTIYLGGIV